MADVTCTSCGADNPAGQKFCGECGNALAATCPSCGTANPPGQRFCGECGTALTTAAASPATSRPAAPAAERRLVSVLFADLVGFTTASEGRDAEETRELLSHYFETARTLVERYGGTVEKFIGDAVMAVWGTPVAQEDDAERAVRAALDLVAAVPALDSTLRARAGVLTGEAAVTLGAEGQGMIAGDLVNTASRIQSAADAGTVLVGEATKRASEAAVAYDDVGEHDLTGKAESAHLWRALRVVANRGGEGRASALEAPFVGRDREFRLVKELFHASGDDGRATLATVVGVAGIGKSRLGRRAAEGVSELERAAHTLASRGQWGFAGIALEWAANGAVLLGEPAAAAPLADVYDTLPPSALTRYLQIEGGRVRALRAGAAGEEDVAADAFAGALAAGRSLGRNGRLAPVLADYGAWLVECGRAEEAEPLLDEARELFEYMGAKRWLERIDAVRPQEQVPA